MNIHDFLARNARVADEHRFASDHKTAVNSALFRAGLPTLGSDKTMGHLRAIVNAHEALVQEPTRPVHEVTVRKAEPTPAPKRGERAKVNCMGVNLSPSSDHPLCARKVTITLGVRQSKPLCHSHADQHGRDHASLIAERAENIVRAEAERKEYLARKEAREMLAEINA